MGICWECLYVPVELKYILVFLPALVGTLVYSIKHRRLALASFTAFTLKLAVAAPGLIASQLVGRCDTRISVLVIQSYVCFLSTPRLVFCLYVFHLDHQIVKLSPDTNKTKAPTKEISFFIARCKMPRCFIYYKATCSRFPD